MPLNELLAFAAIEGAKKWPKDTPLPKMCNDCAFKKGTDANNDETAVEGAGNCLSFYGTFNCHRMEGDEMIDEGKPCAGFLFAKLQMESTPD